MKNRLAIYMGSALLLGSVTLMTLPAQDTVAAPKAPAKKKERASPHEEVSATLAGKKITISYGRPYKKGRVIFGGLEPLGKVWRTGADEATTITLEGDAMIGPLHVVAGTYSLFTIPNEKEWTLVLNKTAKQWGAFKYDQAMDYGRAPMKVTTVKDPVEQLTISIDKKGDHDATLKIAWDQTVATIDLQGH